MNKKRLGIEILVRRDRQGSEEVLKTVSEDVVILDKSLDGLRSLAEVESIRADSCIYCGSMVGLSNEHVIPYAWGGTVQILDGSCGACQKITSKFENFAINDGAMPHVRKALNIQSRSRHKSATSPIETVLTGAGGEAILDLDTELSPMMLGFPLFARPALLSGEEKGGALRLEGMGAVVFGANPLEFMQRHNATSAVQQESSKKIVDFARTIAKIAYCWAWRDGVVNELGGADELVRAFMHDPNQLGTYVGTKPSPYSRYQGCQFRIEYALEMPARKLILEVQPFSDSAAPTYEVVIGEVKSMRQWRQVRAGLR
ncbi:hypothetical protein [Stenotrophomonas sp. PS02289]|uniref:hypothetical protein n=1 Tax=Stenotrophomonas sp. PS02289 TaxID=2991422 RepID=UPI00249A16E9|nr:hypothetical protein [Stenotrophomonas sp. PS02289]